ncbi:unnamed protein product [Musa acuminata subsp. malaccensis]|uniref:(wild Malaysian banana) hypothetical protein n=1 Tax=Musa acuminata subsp. malaccensis TaxID=214687 RepID=A0A804JHM9_MUSAM|nr:unnamed protein product [Musa acuminata subsp. malaccensis]
MSSSPAVVFSLHVRCLYLVHPRRSAPLDYSLLHMHLCEHSFDHHAQHRHIPRAAWVALDCYIK